MVTKVDKRTKKFQREKLKGVLERRKTHAKKVKGVAERDARQERHRVKRSTQEARVAAERAAGFHDEESDDAGMDSEDNMAHVEASDDENDDASSMGSFDAAGSDVEDGASDFDAGEAAIASDSEDDDEEDEQEFADEEDVDAEQAPLSADAHMAQLQKLAETDPEFYAFLAKNDKHLLEFQDQDDAEAEEAEEAEVLTKETVLQWRKQLEQCYRLPTLSRLVAAFQEAVKATVHKNAPNDGKPARFIIRDPKVANLTIAVARRTVSQVLSHHLKIKMPSTDSVSANKAVTLPAELPTWKRCRGVVRRYISSMTDLIRQSHSTALLTFLLRNPQDLGVYAVCFARLKQTFLEVVAQKWALGETAVRAHAFMALRRIAIMFPHHALGDVYKFMYKQFSLLTKKYDARNALDATFTMNCMVELNGLHPATTYRFGFGQIKKLAMLLRKAMHTQSGKEENKQSLAALYAWSTYQTVALWRHTLVTYIPLEDAADGLMSLLVYPLTQIALGIMKLKCSSRYLPMHANLLRELVALCQGTGVFIPLAPYAIAMINLVLARKNVTKSTLKPVPFHTTTRVANAYVGTVVYRQTVLNEASELLTDICGLQAHHIAFPEFVLPVMVQLRKMMKIDNPQAQIAVTKAVKPLLSKLRENADFINAKRKRVTFHPSDAEAVAAFELQLLEMGTPLGRHVQARQRVLERQREADEAARQRQLALEAKKQADAERAEQKKARAGGVVSPANAKQFAKPESYGDGDADEPVHERRAADSDSDSDADAEEGDATMADAADDVEDFVLSESEDDASDDAAEDEDAEDSEDNA